MKMREYKNYHPGLVAPPSRAVAITPDDDTDLDFVTRGIYVAAEGDIRVDTLGGDTAVFTSFPGQSILIGQYTRVYDTGTTATGLVALA